MNSAMSTRVASMLSRSAPAPRVAILKGGATTAGLLGLRRPTYRPDLLLHALGVLLGPLVVQLEHPRLLLVAGCLQGPRQPQAPQVTVPHDQCLKMGKHQMA